MKLWLEDKNIEMYPSHNKREFGVAKRTIDNFKG